MANKSNRGTKEPRFVNWFLSSCLSIAAVPDHSVILLMLSITCCSRWHVSTNNVAPWSVFCSGPCVSVSPVQRVSWNFLTASRTFLAEILSLFAHTIPLNTGQAFSSGQQKLRCDFNSMKVKPRALSVKLCWQTFSQTMMLASLVCFLK